MKLLSTALLLGAGYLGYRALTDTKTPAIVETRPMILDPSKEKLMTESGCAQKASLMDFADDEQKYQWIVNCTQSYSEMVGRKYKKGYSPMAGTRPSYHGIQI